MVDHADDARSLILRFGTGEYDLPIEVVLRGTTEQLIAGTIAIDDAVEEARAELMRRLAIDTGDKALSRGEHHCPESPDGKHYMDGDSDERGPFMACKFCDFAERPPYTPALDPDTEPIGVDEFLCVHGADSRLCADCELFREEFPTFTGAA